TPTTDVIFSAVPHSLPQPEPPQKDIATVTTPTEQRTRSAKRSLDKDLSLETKKKKRKGKRATSCAASHLKGALTRHGFSISDHTRLPIVGSQDVRSQLLKAIEESEIYVVVLSLSYPYSTRCLDELVFIMDSLPKFKKRKIFPIFFNVEPSDVRSQEGSFKEAFQDHENHVNPERVQRWRQALKDAGQSCGITLQNG
ncbi:TMV resistance protein N, partial [Tanacetum coccineum]